MVDFEDEKGTSEAGDALTLEKQKKEGATLKILNEIYETEKTYYDGIDAISNSNFYKAIISEKGVPGVSPEKLVSLKNLLKSWEALCQHSKTMLDASEEGKNVYGMIEKVDDSFLDAYVQYTIDYGYYVNAQASLLESLTKKEQKVIDKYLSEIKMTSKFPVKGLDDRRLQDIWITPVQRTTRYQMLAGELLKNVDKESANRQTVETFFENAKNIAKKINEKKRSSDIIDVQKLSGKDFVNAFIEGVQGGIDLRGVEFSEAQKNALKNYFAKNIISYDSSNLGPLLAFEAFGAQVVLDEKLVGIWLNKPKERFAAGEYDVVTQQLFQNCLFGVAEPVKLDETQERKLLSRLKESTVPIKIAPDKMQEQKGMFGRTMVSRSEKMAQAIKVCAENDISFDVSWEGVPKKALLGEKIKLRDKLNEKGVEFRAPDMYHSDLEHISMLEKLMWLGVEAKNITIPPTLQHMMALQEDVKLVALNPEASVDKNWENIRLLAKNGIDFEVPEGFELQDYIKKEKDKTLEIASGKLEKVLKLYTKGLVELGAEPVVQSVDGPLKEDIAALFQDKEKKEFEQKGMPLVAATLEPEQYFFEMQKLMKAGLPFQSSKWQPELKSFLGRNPGKSFTINAYSPEQLAENIRFALAVRADFELLEPCKKMLEGCGEKEKLKQIVNVPIATSITVPEGQEYWDVNIRLLQASLANMEKIKSAGLSFQPDASFNRHYDMVVAKRKELQDNQAWLENTRWQKLTSWIPKMFRGKNKKEVNKKKIDKLGAVINLSDDILKKSATGAIEEVQKQEADVQKDVGPKKGRAPAVLSHGNRKASASFSEMGEKPTSKPKEEGEPVPKKPGQ